MDGDVGDDERTAQAGGVESGQVETFVDRREHGGNGGAVEGREGRLVDPAEEANVGTAPNALAEALQVPTRWSAMDEQEAGNELHRVQDEAQVLPRLERAHRHHEGPI